jgi:hypothetical protein
MFASAESRICTERMKGEIIGDRYTLVSESKERPDVLGPVTVGSNVRPRDSAGMRREAS